MALDPITAGFDLGSSVMGLGSKIIDKLFPDKASADAAKLKLLEMQQTGELAQLSASVEIAKGQMAVNAEEAKSSITWVSGARPAVIWVCAAAFAYSFVLQPMAVFVLAASGHPLQSVPELNTEALMTVMFSVLGLGAYRSFEKVKGVA